MRSVSTRVRWAGVLVTLIILIAVPGAYADDADPFEPPERRIRPPIGATAQEEAVSFARMMWTWFMARIGPPIGLQ
jgi:hypothetical protein